MFLFVEVNIKKVYIFHKVPNGRFWVQGTKFRALFLHFQFIKNKTEKICQFFKYLLV